MGSEFGKGFWTGLGVVAALVAAGFLLGLIRGK
jgi:hypothetical protein